MCQPQLCFLLKYHCSLPPKGFRHDVCHSWKSKINCSPCILIVLVMGGAEHQEHITRFSSWSHLSSTSAPAQPNQTQTTGHTCLKELIYTTVKVTSTYWAHNGLKCHRINSVQPRILLMTMFEVQFPAWFSLSSSPSVVLNNYSLPHKQLQQSLASSIKSCSSAFTASFNFTEHHKRV